MFRVKAKGVSGKTVAISICLIIFAAMVFSNLAVFSAIGGAILDFLSGKPIIPSREPFAGRIDIDFPVYWRYDKAAQATALPKIYLYHANKVDLVGSDVSTTSTLNIVGNVDPEDKGILYGVIDHDSGTTYYLDDAMSKTGFIVEWFAWDHDNDGTLEWGFKMDVSGVAEPIGGQTAAEITQNLYVIKYESTITVTSQGNATGCNTAGDYYAEGYLAGWTAEGYGWKLVKVELTMPDTANATMVDDGDVELKSISFAGMKWTGYDFSLASKRFLMEIGVPDFNEEYYGKLIYYKRGAGVMFAAYSIHIYAGASFTGSERFTPTLKLWYVNPAGTVASVTRVVNFEGA